MGSADPPSGVWVCLFLFFVFVLFFFWGEGGDLENFQESICHDVVSFNKAAGCRPAPKSKRTHKMDPSILGSQNFAKSSKQVIQRCIWIQSNIYDGAFLRKLFSEQRSIVDVWLSSKYTFGWLLCKFLGSLLKVAKLQFCEKSNSNKNALNKHLKIFMENILRVAPDNYFKKCQEQKQPPEVLCKKRRS